MRSSNDSDEVLFNHVKQGSERAFTQLYNRYWEILLDVAFTRLKSQDDAKDTVQQVFVQLWNRRENIELIYTFKTYISAAVKYKIYDKILERKKYRTFSIDELPGFQPQDYATEQKISFNEMRSRIETVISQLPDKCRLVYRLSREEGLSAREISVRLQINEKTVEGHLTKALKMLKIHFKLLFIHLLVGIFKFF